MVIYPLELIEIVDLPIGRWEKSMGVTKNGEISHGIYHDLPSGND